MLQHEWIHSVCQYATDRFECSGVGDGKAWINRKALGNYHLLNFLRLILKLQIENDQGVMETHHLWFSDTLGWLILSSPFGWAFASVISSGKTHSWCESPFVSGWRALWGHSIWVHLSPFIHLALLPLQAFVSTEQLTGSIKLPPAQACLMWDEFWAVWHSPPPADTWATQLGSVGQDMCSRV